MAEFAFALHRRFLALHLKNVDWAGRDAATAERAEVTIQYFGYQRSKQLRFGYGCGLHVMHFRAKRDASLIGISLMA